MVNTDGQDRTLQDELRRAALKRLVTAIRHGSRARQPNLVLQAATHLWNVAIPLTTSTISRKQIFPFIKAALTELSHANVTKAPEFRIDLYILLFECYTDAEDWSGGLEAVNTAFLQIPAHLQRPLWQQRVVFMSKLGKGVLDGMQKMKESDPVLQAKVWAILARAASSTKQQLTAYVVAGASDTSSSDTKRARPDPPPRLQSICYRVLHLTHPTQPNPTTDTCRPSTRCPAGSSAWSTASRWRSG
jgi:hypothetical protein